MAVVIPLQTEFRPVLRTIRGNVDYESFETDLLRMDQFLVLGGMMWSPCSSASSVRPVGFSPRAS